MSLVPATLQMDEHTHLLVARPHDSKVLCRQSNATVGGGDRLAYVIEPSKRCDKPWVDSRCLLRHPRSVAATTRRLRPRQKQDVENFAPEGQVTVCYLA
jgi:hypothetical protein